MSRKMIDLNMSKISPKLIDVENNRIPTNDKIDRHQSPTKNKICYGVFVKFGSFDDKWKGGRFPTQLFTNINDEKYKYVIKIK